MRLTVQNTSPDPGQFLGTFQKLNAAGQVYTIDDEATFYVGGGVRRHPARRPGRRRPRLRRAARHRAGVDRAACRSDEPGGRATGQRASRNSGVALLCTATTSRCRGKWHGSTNRQDGHGDAGERPSAERPLRHEPGTGHRFCTECRGVRLFGHWIPRRSTPRHHEIEATDCSSSAIRKTRRPSAWQTLTVNVSSHRGVRSGSLL